MNPHDDLEAYVLGALGRPDATAFEAHLVNCQDCRDGVASYSTVMRALRSIPLAAPPSVPAVHSVIPWWRAAAAIILIGAGLAAGAALNRPDSDLATIVAMLADHPREVSLHAEIASGRVIVASSRNPRTAFVVRGLPEPPPGRGYQVWVKGERVSSPGMLHRTRDGLEVLVVNGDAIAGSHHVGITIEPADGSRMRTGATQIQGDIL